MHSLSALEISQQFKDGKLKATQIASHFIKRIRDCNDHLGAYLSILEERVMKKADELDKKRERGEKLGLLAGVPVSIKDNMHIKGEVTTCASQFLKDYVAPFDATVTRLIEEEDGLVLGKLNMDEFAMGSTNENSSFFPVKNPWNPQMVPGGSSGGSAAAVAAGLSALTLGSDTGGSIRLPASFTATVGYKPTYGRVSRYGLVAFGSSLDQIGPIGRSVEDVALMMEVIGRHCSQDSTSLDIPRETYTEELDLSMNGKTVGIPFSLIEQLPEESLAHFQEIVETMKHSGLKVIDLNLDVLKYAMPVYYILAPAEASTNLARFDGILHTKRAEGCESIDDVYLKSRMQGFGPEVKQRILLGTYVLSSGCQEAYYKKAQQVRSLICEAFEEAFKQCDAIAMPTAPYSAFDLGSIRDPLSLYLQDIFTIPANLAGLPAISIPSGFTSGGRPLSLQMMGAREQDGKLLRMARHMEKATEFGARVAPDYDKEVLA